MGIDYIKFIEEIFNICLQIRRRTGCIDHKPYIGKNNLEKIENAIDTISCMRYPPPRTVCFKVIAELGPVFKMKVWDDDAPYSWSRTWLTDAMRRKRKEVELILNET